MQQYVAFSLGDFDAKMQILIPPTNGLCIFRHFHAQKLYSFLWTNRGYPHSDVYGLLCI